MEQGVSKKSGHKNSEAGESAKRKNTTFRKQRHFEIKNNTYPFSATTMVTKAHLNVT